MIVRQHDCFPDGGSFVSQASNRLHETGGIPGANPAEWSSLNGQLWEQACASVADLRGHGIFCVANPGMVFDSDLLWSFLTYAYGNLQFGSQALVEWLETVPDIHQRLGGRLLSSADVRQFRRNNRKMLTLSLEAYFKKASGSVIHRFRRTCGLSECDLAEAAVLEAIRFDVGEVDY